MARNKTGLTFYKYTCLQCGAYFEARAKNRKFCSPSCSSTHNNTGRFKPKVAIQCKFCGKEVLLLPGTYKKKLKKGFKAIYCSRLCTQRDRNPLDFRKKYHEDINISTRSNWEANIARILNYLSIKWEYEPTTFIIRVYGKDIPYTPDFYLPDKNKWIEVKGRWYNKLAKKKFELFSADKNVMLIDPPVYNRLVKRYKSKIDLYSK
jgi:hypothetical protein